MTKVIFSDGIKISEITSGKIEQIRRELTFDNPAYANVKKYSKWGTTRVPPYLNYFRCSGGDSIEVPIGYDLTRLGLYDSIDNRVLKPVTYPPFLLDLRTDQEVALKKYLEMNLNQHKVAGCIKMPTGKGKSILGLKLAEALSQKTLVVVHKDDLVTGWKKDIQLAFGNKVKPGLIKAKSYVVGEHVTIATVQTLTRLPEEKLNQLFNEFGFVIQDEMHHCPASSFEVVSQFKSRYKLGLTATPERADGLAHVMKLYFGEFCYEFEPTKEDDDILTAEVIGRDIQDIYYQPVCTYKGNQYVFLPEDIYAENAKLPDKVGRVISLPYELRPRVPFHVVDNFAVRNAVEDVCKDIVSEYQKGHSCLVFFTQKEHCRIYAEYLTEVLNIPNSDVGLYYGDNKDNQSVLDKAESTRKFITLTTYAKATEGTNVKQWEVVFLVSSLNNGKNVEQAIGRIRRRKEGCKIDPVLVYDYRFPRVFMIANHRDTRVQRYTKLHFNYAVKGSAALTERTGVFTRGYNRSI